MDDQEKVYDVIMIGAGPSSLASAIYTTREDLSTLLIEKGAIGGLAATTDFIENYPGFPEGISGLELSQLFQQQADRFGAEFELGEVSKIENHSDKKTIITDSGKFSTRSILIATGSDYRKLRIPGEEEFYAKGVHYCATCDGAFYRDKKIVVVGGGNSAAQESLFLTKFSKEVVLLVRSEKMTASEILQHRVEKNENITVHYNINTQKIVGNEKVEKIVAKNTQTGENVEFEADGIFVFIGLVPNTKFLEGSGIELDEIGFIKTNEHLMTSVEGIFASGDVRSGANMQVASAVGEGVTAAKMISEYLEFLKN